MTKWESEKENLEKYILVDKLPYTEIGRIYGCTDNNIKKVARNLGIELPQRRKINPSETFNKKEKKKCHCLNCGKELESRNKKYCDIHCQQEYQYKEWVIRWKNGEESGLKGEYGISNYLRHYLLEKFNYKCSKCGWGEENPYTHTLPLEVEHIDGNYLNNNENNLIILCPNCHSLTSTYKGANKGFGRKDRLKYYSEVAQ